MYQFRWIFFCLICSISCAANAGFFVNEYQDSCIKNIQDSSKYELLKINFRSEASKFTRYSNQQKVSDDDRALIPNYVDDLEKCRTAASDSTIKNIDPLITSITNDMFNAYIALTVKLYNREITYGEYFKIMDKEVDERYKLISQREAELNYQQYAIARQEQESQQIADDKQNKITQGLFVDAFKNIQRSFEPKPEINTTCSSLGGTVYCKTR